MKRPVLLKALFAIPDNAASMFPALVCLMGFNALTYPDRIAKMATLARPMTRHRKKGSCMMTVELFSPIAGERRWGAKERAMWAVTTSSEAIPRKPYIQVRQQPFMYRNTFDRSIIHLPTLYLYWSSN